VKSSDPPRSTPAEDELRFPAFRAASTVKESEPLVAVPPFVSTTETVTEKFPAAEGVQVMSADELDSHPVGSPDHE
jgi:hypothetical protein